MLAEYISKEDLEFMAIQALSGFERKNGTIQKWPVPLDAFIETHLGLTLQVKKLDPDLLGYLSVKDRIITINESLDTYGCPQNEGRFNFTLAHEGGHEIAHAPQVRRTAELRDLFNKPREEDSTIFCRKTNAKAQIEYQANYIGAALLMPKKLMHQFWQDRFGDLRQRDETNLLHSVRYDDDFVAAVERRRGDDSDTALLEEHFRPNAKEFAVSPETFCRRLRTLGLLGNSNNREFFSHARA